MILEIGNFVFKVVLFHHEFFLGFVLALEVLLLRLVKLVFKLAHLLLEKSSLSF